MKELDPLSLPLAGRQLIEASAGTGKTYTITTLVLRLLLEQRLDLGQILVVTYTRAATAELRSRVRQRIGKLYRALCAEGPSGDDAIDALCARSRAGGTLEDDRRHMKRALHATDEAAIFTIHGFCQRVLGDYAFETDTPFALELRAHSETLVEEVVRDYWTHATQHIDPELYAGLRRHGPADIQALVLRTLHGPLPRRVPEDEDTPRPDASAWHDALRVLRERWASEQPGLLEALLAAKLGLRATTYAKAFDTLQQALDLRAAPLPDDAAEQLGKLVVDCPAKAAAKGRDLHHPLLEPLRALHEADRAQREWCDAQVRLLLWHAVGYAREALASRTAERGEATFDQLLSRAHGALAGPRRPALVAALQRRYRAALIDEFQDTDPLQYEVFASAFSGLPLLLIGDPKQAIYSFRGADVFAYLRARESVGEAVHTLSTNRRSDPRVIRGLNHLYASCRQPFALDAIQYVPVAPAEDARDALTGNGAAVELLFAEPESKSKPAQEAEVCERVATDIVQTLEAGLRIDGRSLRAGDIAVLCRKNKQAHAVQQALANRGVPSLLQGDSSVFDTPDALEVERLLAALVDPGDAHALRSALAGVYLGLSAADLDGLSEDDAWEQHRERLLEAHRTWLGQGFVQGVRRCLRAYGVDERLMARQDGARRWTNLQHLLELLQEAALHERLGPDGLLRWLRTMRTDLATRGELLGEAAQIRLESLEDAVRLTTVHRSKGLEYPLVYCPFAWEGAARPTKFPLVHDETASSSARLLDLRRKPSEENRARDELEARSDALRVLYVALTRAKHGLRVVCGPLGGRTKGGALHHLLGTDSEDAAAMRETLTKLADGSGGGVGLRELALASPQRLTREPPREVAAEARSLPRRVLEAEQVTSFTALSHGETREGPADSGADHDALPVEAAPAPTLIAPITETEPPVALHVFPRGASAGTTVHELLEQCDFAADADTLTGAAAELLPARGIPARLAPTLGGALFDVLRTPLSDAGMRLCDVPAVDRVAELEFIFRVDPRLRPHGQDLARILRRHAAPDALPEYAERVAKLDFSALGGFLRGFIDLVFQFDGRFYVVDYKSNDLGPRPNDYRPAQLAEAMAKHHYYLQYLLYSIAVHRYLQRRVSGYAYDTHFGGVFYLFLRGMAPGRGARTGVFFDRPSAALMAELDAALAAEGETA